MQVLLDSNVWRYLVDSGSQDRLYRIARQSSVKVMVCPSVVIETLRLSDSALRKKIIEIQTRDCWHRLMPDAYLQCEDVKREIRRTHSEWESDSKNVSLYRKLRFDWVRSNGGFWSEVRNNTDSVAAQYHSKDTRALEEVREQSRDARSSILTGKRKMMVTKSLRDLTGSWTTSSGDNVVVDFWRVYALTVWDNMLSRTDSTFRQWMGCDLDLDLLLYYHTADFIKFWEYEVRTEAVPREWLRAAFFVLQSERKVTDGNPMDASIGVHLVDVDFVVSADRNFVSIVNQCRQDAPFRTANPFLISAGKTGIDQLFQIISERFSGVGRRTK